MEPAVERREHPGAVVVTYVWFTPQWSPPLKGGSTGKMLAEVVTGRQAAMEPAVERREHCQAPRNTLRRPCCRNGARR